MAEALGLAASVIAVVSFTGHIIQSCQTVQATLGDIRDAPDDIEALLHELELTEQSVEVFSGLYKKIDPRGLDFDVTPALEQCNSAVQALKKRVGDVNTLSDMKSGPIVARGWQRFKAISGKHAIKKMTDNLQRANMQVLVAQSNLILYMTHIQHDTFRGVVQSISEFEEISRAFVSKIDGIAIGIEDIQTRTKNTNTTFNQLNSHITELRLDMEQNKNFPACPRSREHTVGNRVDIALGEHAAQYFIGREGVAQVTHAISHKPWPANTPTTTCPIQGFSFACQDPGNMKRDTYDKSLTTDDFRSRHLLWGPTLYGAHILEFRSNTTPYRLGASQNLQNSATKPEEQARLITRLKLYLNLGFWSWGFNATIVRQRKAAPIFQGCCRFDVAKVRMLFETGQASPFDQDPFGHSCFDWAFYAMCNHDFDYQEGRGLELLQFLISCGGYPTSLGHTYSPFGLSWVEEVMEFADRKHKPQMRQLLAEAIRLVLANSPEDPIAQWDVGASITILSKSHDLGEALLQQDHWFIDLRPGQCEIRRWPNTFVENDRQIAEDPDALFMAKALAAGKKYFALFQILPGRMPPQGMHSILILYSTSDMKSKLRFGCRNRLAMLLKAGFDPREVARLSDQAHQGFMKMSVTEYARHVGAFDLWHEALIQAGWTSSDIQEIIEEDSYDGLQILLNSELIYSTMAEIRQDFLNQLATGHYIGMSSDKLHSITVALGASLDLHWFNGKLTIEKASLAFARLRTPGSWPQDSPIELQFGVDFFLYDDLRRSFSSIEAYEAHCGRRRVLDFGLAAPFC